ncbi:MAG TPA: tail fiber domain-containing protein [Abditibacteriaceae bacterium]
MISHFKLRSTLSRTTLIFAFAGATLCPRLAHAEADAIGSVISYQGKLTEANGVAVADGKTNVVFRIYEIFFNIPIVVYNNAGTAQEVETVGGVFNAFIPVGDFEFDPTKTYELGIQAGNNGEVRHPIAAVPMALKTKNAVDLTTNQTIGGVKTFSDTLKATSSLLATGSIDINTTLAPAEGAGVRLMWFPGRGAFRAGEVNGTQWDDANLGFHSTAFGLNSRASGDYGFAAGNRVVAANTSSVALGQDNTASGYGSVALGIGAHTNARRGSFVFADDSVPVDTTSISPEYFRARAARSANWRTSGGFHVYTHPNLTEGVSITGRYPAFSSSNNWDRSDALISTSTGAYLSNGGVWTNSSSRALKSGFTPVDGREVLKKVAALPMTSWNYKADPNARHIGPMAQDFHDAFNLGGDNEHIGTVDADGVALAAIQGLNSELQDTKAELKERDAKIAALEARMKKLEALLQQP